MGYCRIALQRIHFGRSLEGPWRGLSVLTSGGLASSKPGVHATHDEGAALEEKPSQILDRIRAEGDVVAAGVTSGTPSELTIRPVRIFRQSPSTTQSAKATSHHWRIDWDILPTSSHYENPLMGWTASSDYMQGTRLKFQTKDAAIEFAQKHGYPYYVQEPHNPRFKPKSYSNNFLYQPNKLRIIPTK